MRLDSEDSPSLGERLVQASRALVAVARIEEIDVRQSLIDTARRVTSSFAALERSDELLDRLNLTTGYSNRSAPPPVKSPKCRPALAPALACTGIRPRTL
jgi:hypothetical protein